jgi:hypothetical protein
MRSLLLLVSMTFFVIAAHANPALHGTWSVAVDGQPFVVTFEPNGGGKVNATPMKWQAMGKLLFVQQQGGQVMTYSWDVKGDKLSVAGGDLSAPVALSRGTAAVANMKKPASPSAAASRSAGGQELVGKWCKLSSFSATSGGGSSRSTCFELRPDGTYVYQHEGSMSGTTGAMASQSSDAGRWQVTGNQLTARSRSGQVNTYTLEKRNHPTNKRDPMICLNGECYVTFYNKPAW